MNNESTLVNISNFNLIILFLEITFSTIVPRHESEKRCAEKSHARDNHIAGMSNDMIFFM